jgi:hypothetical protein
MEGQMPCIYRTLAVIVFFIVNCYAIKWACAGMSYRSDLTFFLGFAGLLLLIAVDIVIGISVLKAILSKGDRP